MSAGNKVSNQGGESDNVISTVVKWRSSDEYCDDVILIISSTLSRKYIKLYISLIDNLLRGNQCSFKMYIIPVAM